MDEITLTIKMFGAFRDYVANSVLELTAAPGTRVSDIKTLINKELLAQGCPASIDQLLKESVFASNHSIQSDEDVIETSGEYGLLPPVCGG